MGWTIISGVPVIQEITGEVDLSGIISSITNNTNLIEAIQAEQTIQNNAIEDLSNGKVDASTYSSFVDLVALGQSNQDTAISALQAQHKRVTFDVHESYVSGEKPLSAQLSWNSTGNGSPANNTVTIDGIAEKVITLNDTSASTYELTYNLAQSEIDNAFANGAVLSFTGSMTQAQSLEGVTLSFQVDAANSPNGSNQTVTSRYGVILKATSATDSRLTIVGLQGGFGAVIVNGTDVTKMLNVVISIPPSFTQADLWINGFKQSVFPFYSQSTGTGSKVTITTNGTSGVVHIKEYGLTVLNEPSTKVLDNDLLRDAGTIECWLPKALTKTFTLRLASDVNLLSTTQLNITCTNEFGNLVIDNVAATPNILINGKGKFEQQVYRTQRFVGSFNTNNRLDLVSLYNNVKVERKTELVYTGINVVIPQYTTGLGTNLLSVLPTLPAASYYPFINNTVKKVQSYNETTLAHFKVSLIGTMSGGNNGGIELDLNGLSGNATAFRLASTSNVVCTFSIPIAVTKGGAAATTGFEPRIKAIGGNLTITQCRIIMVQPVDEWLPMVPLTA